MFENYFGKVASFVKPLNVERLYETTWKWARYFYYISLWALYVILPCAVTFVITQLDALVFMILASWHSVFVAVMLFCGIYYVFTVLWCRRGGYYVLWHFVMWPWESFMVSKWCWITVMAHMEYYVVSWSRLWKTLCCIILLNLSILLQRRWLWENSY